MPEVDTGDPETANKELGRPSPTEVTLPPAPRGPIVEPLICAKAPAVVVHISPLTGLVGAVPGVTLNPAPFKDDGDVISFEASKLGSSNVAMLEMMFANKEFRFVAEIAPT